MLKHSTINPFSSKIYETVWLKHFYHGKSAFEINSIRGVKFIKHSVFPYYVNVGTNTTNGLVYGIYPNSVGFKNTVSLIYDVPNYLNIDNEGVLEELKVKKVRQYPGFATNLKDFENFDEFTKSNFSSSSRKRFRRSFRRLELCGTIRYETFYGELNKETYNIILKQFKSLIKKRYDELNLDVTLLARWPFFSDLILPMIRQKKAAIFAIYHNDNPISMSLVFLNENSLFNAVKAFDADYYKFNIGHLDITKIFEWCFEHNISAIDFSKGEYEYKTRWTNTKYYYDCHILYDSKNLKTVSLSILLSKYFWFKQYLRDKKVNFLYSKIKYILKNKRLFNNKEKGYTIEIISEEMCYDIKSKINFKSMKYLFLKRIILDKLYSAPEPITNLNVYKIEAGEKLIFAVIGELNKFKVIIN